MVEKESYIPLSVFKAYQASQAAGTVFHQDNHTAGAVFHQGNHVDASYQQESLPQSQITSQEYTESVVAEASENQFIIESHRILNSLRAFTQDEATSLGQSEEVQEELDQTPIDILQLLV